MKRLLVVVACLAMLSVAFTIEAGEKEDAPKVVQVPISWHQAAMSDGEQLYGELCAVCHGAKGVGDGPAAKALAMPMPDLTLIKESGGGVYPREAVEDAIRGQGEIVAHGTPEMPIWGRVFADARIDQKPGLRWALAEQRIQNLASYIETIQK